MVNIGNWFEQATNGRRPFDATALKRVGSPQAAETCGLPGFRRTVCLVLSLLREHSGNRQGVVIVHPHTRWQVRSIRSPEGDKAAGTHFDRFGIVTSWIDGNIQDADLDVCVDVRAHLSSTSSQDARLRRLVRFFRATYIDDS